MQSARFISLVAESYCLDRKTVSTFARFLKEAGLLQTGAVGVNSLAMTARDAARLTIALLATDKPSRAVDRAKAFGSLMFNRTWSEGDDLKNFCDGLTVEKYLSEIFDGGPAVAGFSGIEFNRTLERVTVNVFAERGKFEARVFDGLAADVEAVYRTPEAYGARIKAELPFAAIIPIFQGLKE